MGTAELSPVTLQTAVTRPKNGSRSAMDDMNPMMVMMLKRMDDGEMERFKTVWPGATGRQGKRYRHCRIFR